uniref:Uncharacterized protein n=1 Tax=Cucumis melo TaxID=3656 RepID=A0A9I9EA70_CUCME
MKQRNPVWVLTESDGFPFLLNLEFFLLEDPRLKSALLLTQLRVKVLSFPQIALENLELRNLNQAKFLKDI